MADTARSIVTVDRQGLEVTLDDSLGDVVFNFYGPLGGHRAQATLRRSEASARIVARFKADVTALLAEGRDFARAHVGAGKALALMPDGRRPGLYALTIRGPKGGRLWTGLLERGSSTRHGLNTVEHLRDVLDAAREHLLPKVSRGA